MEKYDKIIIGAGLYGLYSALFCAKEASTSSFWSATRLLLGEQPILIRHEFIKDIIIPDQFQPR